MSKEHKDTIRIRIISTAFSVLALAVFKPFGLKIWQGNVYLHLSAIFVLGFMVCLLSDAVMRYIVRMSCDKDDIIHLIRRNLYFQIINTVLESLMICMYRHFMLSDLIPANHLSWGNFFETLIIIAFCSFAIGLYWRFKFRSKYLAMELEETQMLNEQLKELQQATDKQSKEAERISGDKSTSSPHTGSEGISCPQSIMLTGTTSESVALDVSDLLYVEAVGNYVKVYHLRDGSLNVDMLRATSHQIEDELKPYPMIVRCHRAFLVNLAKVRKVVSKAGKMQLIIEHSQEPVPVSRSNITHIKAAVLKK